MLNIPHFSRVRDIRLSCRKFPRDPKSSISSMIACIWSAHQVNFRDEFDILLLATIDRHVQASS